MSNSTSSTSLNRFERSAIRAFFTLPNQLLSKPRSTTETLYNKPFHSSLRRAQSITKDSTTYYIIWFDDPEQIDSSSFIDLSFRDFSAYGIVPVVLIRERQQSTA